MNGHGSVREEGMPKDCIIMEIERSKRRMFVQLINHINHRV